MIRCPKCKKELGKPPLKIGFREVCPACEAELHTCQNCRFYMPGKPNDCNVPGTDPIRERDQMNFCEEFQVKIEAPPSPSNSNAKRIFGIDDGDEKVDFNSLFKDP